MTRTTACMGTLLATLGVLVAACGSSSGGGGGGAGSGGSISSVQLATGTRPDTPAIAVADTGGAMAVWVQQSAVSTNDVYGALYTAGTGWGAPVKISTNAATKNSTYPLVVWDAGTGDYLAMWLTTDPAVCLTSLNPCLASSEYTTGWSAQQALTDANAGNTISASFLSGTQPKLVAYNTAPHPSQALAVWVETTGPGAATIYYEIYAYASNTWGDLELWTGVSAPILVQDITSIRPLRWLADPETDGLAT